ncbi:hypothetical protein SBD_7145 [Streptomyces bottropensis ATCC 25435]|uniref:Uncharacterized protein n=1 Tax=Streptomyces bottropensis ATCC 25435 TaxID=1054862 RepID=M3FEZ0_9ACTN|nr:hypothetical protein SBD_7145 [Streptomyces bottropensis ATCC 25435]
MTRARAVDAPYDPYVPSDLPDTDTDTDTDTGSTSVRSDHRDA